MAKQNKAKPENWSEYVTPNTHKIAAAKRAIKAIVKTVQTLLSKHLTIGDAVDDVFSQIEEQHGDFRQMKSEALKHLFKGYLTKNEIEVISYTRRMFVYWNKPFEFQFKPEGADKKKTYNVKWSLSKFHADHKPNLTHPSAIVKAATAHAKKELKLVKEKVQGDSKKKRTPEKLVADWVKETNMVIAALNEMEGNDLTIVDSTRQKLNEALMAFDFDNIKAVAGATK